MECICVFDTEISVTTVDKHRIQYDKITNLCIKTVLVLKGTNMAVNHQHWHSSLLSVFYV
jgi:hypothetical protein